FLRWPMGSTPKMVPRIPVSNGCVQVYRSVHSHRRFLSRFSGRNKFVETESQTHILEDMEWKVCGKHSFEESRSVRTGFEQAPVSAGEGGGFPGRSTLHVVNGRLGVGMPGWGALTVRVLDPKVGKEPTLQGHPGGGKVFAGASEPA